MFESVLTLNHTTFGNQPYHFIKSALAFNGATGGESDQRARVGGCSVHRCLLSRLRGSLAPIVGSLVALCGRSR